MGDCETRAQGGAVASIKCEERVGRSVAQPTFHPPLKIVASPGGAEALTLEAQERDLVNRIDYAQARIELQAVDDAPFVIEPNMLGP